MGLSGDRDPDHTCHFGVCVSVHFGNFRFSVQSKKIMHYVIVMYIHLSACLFACDVLLAPKLIDLFAVWYTFTKTELYWLIMKSTVLIECCVVHALQYFVLFCFVLSLFSITVHLKWPSQVWVGIWCWSHIQGSSSLILELLDCYVVPTCW